MFISSSSKLIYMNLSTMRFLDKFVGVPICLILSFFNKFRISKSVKTKNILIIQLAELGSIILAYPALKKLKELYPDSNLYFLTFKKHKEVVNLLGLIPPKNVLTLDSSNFFSFFSDTLKFLFKKKNFDTAIDFELFSRFSNILSFLSGAKKRLGYHKYKIEGMYRGNLLTHKVEYNPHRHISISFLSLVYSLIAPKQIPLPKLKVNPELSLPKLNPSTYVLEKFNLPKDKKIVVLNPSGGVLPLRAWPYYLSLSKILLKNNDVLIVIIGTKETKFLAKKIINSLKSKRVIDLTAKTSINDLISLYSVSKLQLTNDSGPAHLASLTDIKNVVFFGPETPKLYSPLGDNNLIFYSDFLCSPCISAFNHRNSPCKNNLCLQSISPSFVFEKIKNII